MHIDGLIVLDWAYIMKIDIEMNNKVSSQNKEDIRNHELAWPYCYWFIYVNLSESN
jgi:hypothetical protein